MYSLDDYGHMIADAGRITAYGKALQAAVHPGDVVVEIGCGPGIFALLACRAGAKRVYAIDQEEIVYLARQLAVANHFSGRIEIIQGDSRKVDLPERVNVLVSDIRGVLPLFGHAVPTMEDARRRFLAPDGIVIPQRDILMAAVVEAREFYSQLTSPWRSVDGLDLSLSIPLILNEYYTVRFKTDQLLTGPKSWAVLDYAATPHTRANAELNFRVTRPGIANGLALWFDTELFDGIGYSSGPNGVAVIYGQVFLPWLESVEVSKGQQIRVALCADPVGTNYVWRWETHIRRHNGEIQRKFSQSTFHGASFTPDSLRRRAADFVPVLSETGQADRWLLQAIDGNTSLQQMAQAAAARFPTIFQRWEDALHRAAELARRFSR